MAAVDVGVGVSAGSLLGAAVAVVAGASIAKGIYARGSCCLVYWVWGIEFFILVRARGIEEF